MRTVFITGGSRGIGAAVTRKFAASGDKVFFTYNNSKEAAEKLAEETGAIPVFCNVADPASVDRALCAAENVDVLVTSAGISKIGLITDTDNETWNELVATNLSGTFYTVRKASEIMVKNHSGRIITIGSVWGNYGASCEVAYSATKAGVRGLTKALAKELAPSNITVNCIEPGVIDTDMNAHFSPEDRQIIENDIPVGRMGTPEEVASLVYYLASSDAAYITGQCIGIDGGFC